MEEKSGSEIIDSFHVVAGRNIHDTFKYIHKKLLSFFTIAPETNLVSYQKAYFPY
jgi:hypothetical protein